MDNAHDILNGNPHWQGAEAKVYKGEYEGKAAIYKQRFVKTYRHPFLDQKLNSRRINQESRCLEKAKKLNVATPTVYRVDSKAFLLIMEYIDGISVKQALLDQPALADATFMATDIGTMIAKLHSNNIIHGDLTTSNILLCKKGQDLEKCVMIDFGLACISASIEDRAVDLYVLERAILSTHPEIGAAFFKKILNTYSTLVTNQEATLNKLANVQKRGRKRDMIG